MQRLEVSGVVRYIYIYIYIYDVRWLKVNTAHYNMQKIQWQALRLTNLSNDDVRYPGQWCMKRM
jgi:hypothetical protein